MMEPATRQERAARVERKSRRLPPPVSEIDRALVKKYGALPAPRLEPSGMIHLACSVPDLRGGSPAS